MNCEEQLTDKIIELIKRGTVSYGFCISGNLNQIEELTEHHTNYQYPPRQIIMKVMLDDDNTLLMYASHFTGKSDAQVSVFIQRKMGEYGDCSYNYETILYDYDIKRTTKLYIMMMTTWDEFSHTRKQQSCEKRLKILGEL